MSLVLFIVVLAVLILSHEFGHFIVAKKSGIRVDEFGLGFPPRLVSFRKGETIYSLNLIPFGGFVRIHGENPDDESMSGPDSARSMVNKPKWTQAAVLVAGVAMNILLAWVLISAGFITGLPTAQEGALAGDQIENVSLMITRVLPDSPAEKAGLKAGDRITNIESGDHAFTEPTAEQAQKFFAEREGKEIRLTFTRGENTETINVTPTSGVVEGKAAVGVSMDMVGTLSLPPHKALWRGAKMTVQLTGLTAVGLYHFFTDLFQGESDVLETVTGPVGLIGLVGDASTLGLAYLLTFTAFISINLAVLNLIPFPALDGGRLLFLGIEAIKGSRIDPRIANGLNLIGFLLLIGLMLLVTYSDITKLL